jgi:hypothetical protein
MSDTSHLSESQLSRLLAAHVARAGHIFYSQGRELTPDEVAGTSCMLPAIVWQAEVLHRIAFENKSTGVRFHRDHSADRDAFTGTRFILPETPNEPRSRLPLFCIEVLVSTLERFPYEAGANLDPIVTDFENALRSGIVPGVELPAPQPEEVTSASA